MSGHVHDDIEEDVEEDDDVDEKQFVTKKIVPKPQPAVVVASVIAKHGGEEERTRDADFVVQGYVFVPSEPSKATPAEQKSSKGEDVGEGEVVEGKQIATKKIVQEHPLVVIADVVDRHEIEESKEKTSASPLRHSSPSAVAAEDLRIKRRDSLSDAMSTSPVAVARAATTPEQKLKREAMSDAFGSSPIPERPANTISHLRRQSLGRTSNSDLLTSSSPLTTRIPMKRLAAMDFLSMPRDVIFCIIAFLSDGDLFNLSRVCKRLTLYCFSDFLVFERRFKRQFPFDMTAIWKLIGKRYPMLLLASGNLSLREKSAVIDKYIRDTIDRNANWDKVCFDLFVENGVCRKDQKAAFFLFNFMRNPHLRSGKAKDHFFENVELVNETLALFDLRSCTLFESLHVVFGHALSLPGEAQKIDRAMSAFGAAYRRSCSEELRKNNSEDAFYILAFAMVMLNSDLHNPAVKSRMSLAQFRRNLEGAIVLSEAESLDCYMQVLRCEMVEGSYFTAKMSKPVWLVRHGPLGYKRSRRASVTLCAGELVLDGSDDRYSLRSCCIARNTTSVGGGLSTLRSSSQPTEMNLLHVLRVAPNDAPEALLGKRFVGDLILTTENPEDLKDLQRAMAAHVLPGLQARLTGTMRNLV